MVGLLFAVPTLLLSARFVADAGARRADDGAAAGGAGLPIASRTPPTTSATIATGSTSDRTSRDVDGLAPGLVDAFARAREAATAAGHDLTITSGFRTAAEQQELLDAEVDRRGSREEALWWVFPADRSMHVRGLAVDVGDRGAAAWLLEAGARFGLCHTLSWEWWHFEWRERWEAARACPSEARNPSEAPDVDADGASPTIGSPPEPRRAARLAERDAG